MIGAASIIETDCNVDFDEPVGYRESKYATPRERAESLGNLGGGLAIATTEKASAPRELQKAKIENKKTEALSFVAFKGNANRIDGKSVGEAAPRKSDEADGKSAPTFRGSDVSGVQKSSIPTTGGRTLLGTNNSITEGSGYPNANSASAVLGFESRQSKIGDKYSKKKNAATAFTGTGNKLL